jgi:ferredoxin-type protein NapH
MSATRLLGVVPLVDPLAAMESVLASRSVTLDVVVGASILLVTALLLGPVFCGWVCPLGFLFDLNQVVRRRLFHRAPQPPVLAHSALRKRDAASGIGVLAFFGSFALVARIPLFQILSPINLVVQALVFQLLGGLVLIGLLLLVDSRWPRAWCRFACPLGKLYFTVERKALLRVAIDHGSDEKVFCQQCSIHCPMQIRVMEDYVCRGRAAVTDPQCIRCGACVEACPGGVLRLGLPRR